MNIYTVYIIYYILYIILYIALLKDCVCAVLIVFLMSFIYVGNLVLVLQVSDRTSGARTSKMSDVRGQGGEK